MYYPERFPLFTLMYMYMSFFTKQTTISTKINICKDNPLSYYRVYMVIPNHDVISIGCRIEKAYASTFITLSINKELQKF